MSQDRPASVPGPLWRKRLVQGAVLGLFVLPPAWFLGIIRTPKPKLGLKLEPYASIAHPEVDEASGIVQSDANPNLLWVHNDSGDRSRIFAITVDGQVIVPDGSTEVNTVPKVGERLYQGVAVNGATLIDWEDVTCHADRLYISEMGNNFNNRRDLGVYQVVEPNPYKAESVPAEAFIPVRYPDQTSFPPTDGWNFDCEATFWWEGHLYFITKSRPAFRLYIQGTQAGLYRLDSMSTKSDNVLTKVDQVLDLGGWVTSAGASHDGRYLAVLVESPVSSVWLFERPSQGDKFFSESPTVRRRVFHGGGQLESLTFYQAQGKDEILLLNEERYLFRLSLDDFQTVTRPK